MSATTECVTDYNNLCVEWIIQTMTIKCFINDRPVSIVTEKAAKHKEESHQRGRQGVTEESTDKSEK